MKNKSRWKIVIKIQSKKILEDQLIHYVNRKIIN
jgi:hypothetical protein